MEKKSNSKIIMSKDEKRVTPKKMSRDGKKVTQKKKTEKKVTQKKTPLSVSKFTI